MIMCDYNPCINPVRFGELKCQEHKSLIGECEYCGNESKMHKCVIRDRKKLNNMFEYFERMARGEKDYSPVTSRDLFNRERRIQDAATAIKLRGGKVNPDYDMEVGYSE